MSGSVAALASQQSKVPLSQMTLFGTVAGSPAAAGKKTDMKPIIENPTIVIAATPKRTSAIEEPSTEAAAVARVR